MVISAPVRALYCGKLAEQSEQRNAELLRPGVEMAIAAGEIVAGKALRRIGNLADRYARRSR